MFGLFAAFGNFGGIFMPWLVGVTADVSALNLGAPPIVDAVSSATDASTDWFG